MTVYEKIDLLADAYNPFVLLILFVFLINTFIKGDKLKSGVLFLSLCTGMLCVYGMGWVDKYFNLYESQSLDYSTHTAFSLNIVLILVSFYLSPIKKWLLISSFIFYLFIMDFQQYHTPIDMMVTLLNVTPLFFIIIFVAKKRLVLGKS